EALQLFVDHAGQIDLLLADVSLPRGSGLQVALHFRSEMPNLPVILISGYGVIDWTERNCADLAKLGSDFVTILQKPFTPEQISNAVSKLIGTAPSGSVTTP